MTSPGAGSRPSYIGVRLPASEDIRLAAGRHTYVADVSVPGVLDVAMVRSTLPHAFLTRVDTSQAKLAAGVVDVVTASDLSGLSPVPHYFPWAQPVSMSALSEGKVRYVGAPVAAVVARDRYMAEDAAELVEVHYEELIPVVALAEALAPGAPLLYENWPDNKMIDIPAASPGIAEAFAAADRVVAGTYVTQRHTAVPMEPRATIAEYASGRLTVWTTTQIPYICRSILATALGLAESAIRVISPDLGGGFGAKAAIYPEELLVSWLAIRLGRPVRFVEDRIEHMVATSHSRDMVVDLEAAVSRTGHIIAVRGSVTQDLGSEEIYPPSFAMALTAAGSLCSPYRIPLQAIGVTAVVTNKTPSGAFRGFGLGEAVFAMERLIDKIAGEVGRDPVSLRRDLLIRPEDLPHVTPSGAIIDSGSHLQAFERVVQISQDEVVRARQHLAGDHIRVGVGFANYVEGVVPTYYPTTGRFTQQESCAVRVDVDGSIIVRSSLQGMGQGASSMIATLAAEAFGVELAQVRVITGDTDMTPHGLGSWGSRGTGVFGGACLKAAGNLVLKARLIAAGALEADVEDIEFANGGFRVRGTAAGGLTWQDVATIAYERTFDLPPGVDPGLETTAFYLPPGVDDVPAADGTMNACASYTNASHAAVVSVDIRTGLVRVLHYFVVHDCGTVINPMLVEGQVQGGVAQGIGGALLEEIVYDEHGQPRGVTFADYMLPTATDIPPISVEHIESPAPSLAFGAKGAGEAGVAGPAPAIAAAIEDALRDLGVSEFTQAPFTPQAVLSHIGGRTPQGPQIST
jgi:aerobic carbon-monoxide dehydrogenase large subunit